MTGDSNSDSGVAGALNYSDVGFTQPAITDDSWPGDLRRHPGVDRQTGVSSHTAMGPLPAGYRYLRFAQRLPGRNFEATADAVLAWGVHAEARVRIESSIDRVEVGALVITCLGGRKYAARVPCRVVWVDRTEDRSAFGYGSVVGHPFAGEEAFQVERRVDGEVWFSAVAYSRADRWYSRLAGPLAPVLQRMYLQWLGRAAGRISLSSMG